MQKIKLDPNKKIITMKKHWCYGVGYYDCGYVGVLNNSPLYKKFYDKKIFLLGDSPLNLINLKRDLSFSGTRKQTSGSIYWLNEINEKPFLSENVELDLSPYWFFGFDSYFSEKEDDLKRFGFSVGECFKLLDEVKKLETKIKQRKKLLLWRNYKCR